MDKNQVTLKFKVDEKGFADLGVDKLFTSINTSVKKGTSKIQTTVEDMVKSVNGTLAQLGKTPAFDFSGLQGSIKSLTAGIDKLISKFDTLHTKSKMIGQEMAKTANAPNAFGSLKGILDTATKTGAKVQTADASGNTREIREFTDKFGRLIKEQLVNGKRASITMITQATNEIAKAQFLGKELEKEYNRLVSERTVAGRGGKRVNERRSTNQTGDTLIRRTGTDGAESQTIVPGRNDYESFSGIFNKQTQKNQALRNQSASAAVLEKQKAQYAQFKKDAIATGDRARAYAELLAANDRVAADAVAKQNKELNSIRSKMTGNQKAYSREATKTLIKSGDLPTRLFNILDLQSVTKEEDPLYQVLIREREAVQKALAAQIRKEANQAKKFLDLKDARKTKFGPLEDRKLAAEALKAKQQPGSIEEEKAAQNLMKIDEQLQKYYASEAKKKLSAFNKLRTQQKNYNKEELKTLTSVGSLQDRLGVINQILPGQDQSDPLYQKLTREKLTLESRIKNKAATDIANLQKAKNKTATSYGPLAQRLLNAQAISASAQPGTVEQERAIQDVLALQERVNKLAVQKAKQAASDYNKLTNKYKKYSVEQTKTALKSEPDLTKRLGMADQFLAGNDQNDPEYQKLLRERNSIEQRIKSKAAKEKAEFDKAYKTRLRTTGPASSRLTAITSQLAAALPGTKEFEQLTGELAKIQDKILKEANAAARKSAAQAKRDFREQLAQLKAAGPGSLGTLGSLASSYAPGTQESRLIQSAQKSLNAELVKQSQRLQAPNNVPFFAKEGALPALARFALGYRSTGTVTGQDANGNAILRRSYQNAAGDKLAFGGGDNAFSLTKQGGVGSALLRIPLIAQFMSAASGFSNIFTHSLKFLRDLPGKIQGALLSLSFLVYTVKNVSTAFNTVIFHPIERLAKAFVGAAESSRKFEYSLGGIVGNRNAVAINNTLGAASRNQPFSLEQLRQSAQSLAYIPALSGRLASATPEQAGKQALQLAEIVRKLAIVVPEQGESGALIAIRELVQGQSTSLRRRFGFDSSTLAGQLNVSSAEISRDPNLALKSLDKLLNALIPQSTVDQFNNLVSTKITQIVNAFELGFQKIADTGLFDQIVVALDGFKNKLFDFVESNDFKELARKLSGYLGYTVDNVVAALGKFTDSLFGGSGFAGFATAVDKIGQTVARFSTLLPHIGSFIGSIGNIAGKGVSVVIDSLVKFSTAMQETIKDIRQTAQDLRPGNLVSSAIKHSVTPNATMALAAGAPGFLSGAKDFATRMLFKALSPNYGDAATNVVGGGLGAFAGGIGNGRYRGLGVDETMSKVASDYYAAADSSRSMIFPGSLPGLRSRTLPETIRAEIAKTSALQDQAWKQFAADNERLSVEVRKLGNLPSLSAILLSLNSAGQGISELYDKEQSKSEKIESAFEKLKGSYDVFDNLRKAADSISESLAKARGPLSNIFGGRAYTNAAGQQKSLFGIGGLAPNLSARIGRFFGMANEQANGRPAFELAASQLGSLSQSAAVLRAQELLKFSGTGGAAMDLWQGTDKDTVAIRNLVAQALRSVESNKQIPFGIRSLTGDERLDVYNALADRQFADLDRPSRLGDSPSGSFAERLSSISGRRNAFETDQEKLTNLKNLAMNYADELARAKEDGGMSPAALAEADAKLNDFIASFDELNKKLNYTRQAFIDFAVGVRSALESNLSNAIAGLIDGTATLGDALKGFAKDIIRTFSDIASRNLIRSLLGDFGNAGANNPLSAGGGILGPLLGGIGRLFSGGGAKANGGIFQGGFRAFAGGGIASSPTFGLVGEGRHPEAIIPMPGGTIPMVATAGGFAVSLPGNRLVPTSMKYSSFTGAMGSSVGGMGMNQNIFVVASLDDAVKHGLRANKDLVVNIAAKDIVKGGKIGKAMRHR